MATTIIQLKNLLVMKQNKFLTVIKSQSLFKLIIKKESLLKLYYSLDKEIVKAALASKKVDKPEQEKQLFWYYQIEFMALKEQVGAYLYALTGDCIYVTTSVGKQIANDLISKLRL